MAYATYADVNQLYRADAQFTLTTTPNITTIGEWITEYEAQLNSALIDAGYSAPVTGVNDIALCRGLVAKGVACLAWGVRFPVDETALPKQVDNWCNEWAKALERIADKKFALVDQTRRARISVAYSSVMADND